MYNLYIMKTSFLIILNSIIQNYTMKFIYNIKYIILTVYWTVSNDG